MGAPPVSAQRCEELNAEAADADVNAAYFMHLSHNAANATAWGLEPEQTAWIGVLNTTCGANWYACRIRLSRQRTRVLLGPQRD